MALRIEFIAQDYLREDNVFYLPKGQLFGIYLVPESYESKSIRLKLPRLNIAERLLGNPNFPIFFPFGYFQLYIANRVLLGTYIPDYMNYIADKFYVRPMRYSGLHSEYRIVEKTDIVAQGYFSYFIPFCYPKLPSSVYIPVDNSCELVWKKVYYNPYNTSRDPLWNIYAIYDDYLCERYKQEIRILEDKGNELKCTEFYANYFMFSLLTAGSEDADYLNENTYIKITADDITIMPRMKLSHLFDFQYIFLPDQNPLSEAGFYYRRMNMLSYLFCPHEERFEYAPQKKFRIYLENKEDPDIYYKLILHSFIVQPTIVEKSLQEAKQAEKDKIGVFKEAVKETLTRIAGGKV